MDGEYEALPEGSKVETMNFPSRMGDEISTWLIENKITPSHQQFYNKKLVEVSFAIPRDYVFFKLFWGERIAEEKSKATVSREDLEDLVYSMFPYQIPFSGFANSSEFKLSNSMLSALRSMPLVPLNKTVKKK